MVSHHSAASSGGGGGRTPAGEQVITIDMRKNPELVDRLFASMVGKKKRG